MAASGGVKVVLTAIFGNSLITLVKFIGWIVSSSPSLLAEAVHSLADTFNQVLLLVGIKQSQKGVSKLFPWGTGNARYVWNLISAMGIFFIGFGVTTYHGVHSLLSGGHGGGESSVLIIAGVLIFSLIVEGYALLVAVKEVNINRGTTPFITYLKNSDDPTVTGVVLEDGVAVLGVIIALISIIISHFTKSHIPDAIGSIVIGLLLGVMALMLARLNGMFLIGTSTHSTKENEIRVFLENYPLILKIEKLTTVIIGTGQVHLSADIEWHGEKLIDTELISSDAAKIKAGAEPGPILVKTAERMVRIMGQEINLLEQAIQKRFPEVTQIELEVN